MYDITHSVIMTSYPIYNVSTILLSWLHNDYTWHLTHNIWHHSHCICVITPDVSITSQPVWKSSHLAYGCHHTHSTWHHIHTLGHQCSVFMTSQPLHSWHQISYIWHHNHSVWHLIPYPCDITATISVSSHPLCLGIHIQYIWHQTHSVRTTATVSDITPSIPVSVWSHPLYRWCHTHCM